MRHFELTESSATLYPSIIQTGLIGAPWEGTHAKRVRSKTKLRNALSCAVPSEDRDAGWQLSLTGDSI